MPRVIGKVLESTTGREGMATKKNECTRAKLSKKLDPKYDYYVKNCKDKREKYDVSFLGIHFEPGESVQCHSHPCPPP
jgi:hypothetical protein